MAFAYAVPFEIAVTNPEGLMEAMPVPGTMLQVTFWLAEAGTTVATNCNVPPSVVIVAGTPFCVATVKPIRPPIEIP